MLLLELEEASQTGYTARHALAARLERPLRLVKCGVILDQLPDLVARSLVSKATVQHVCQTGGVYRARGATSFEIGLFLGIGHIAWLEGKAVRRYTATSTFGSLIYSYMHDCSRKAQSDIPIISFNLTSIALANSSSPSASSPVWPR